MSYDANKYRALGVGEVIHRDCYVVAKGEHFDSSPTPVNGASGATVEADDLCDYLELLPVAQPIAKTTHASGAARSAAEGRGRFDLIPYEGQLALARRFEEGAKHFGDQNWRKGMPLSRILSSLRRHSAQVGYDYTEDHAAAVAWNAFAWITIIEDIRAGILPRELDDLGVIDKEARR